MIKLRRYENVLKGFKSAPDRSLTPTWANMVPSWTPSGRPNPVKTYGLSMFLLLRSFASSDAQDGPKTAPRAPQEASRGPERTPRGPKRAPRGPQDGPKAAPRRLQERSYVDFFGYRRQGLSKKPPGPLQEAPRPPQDPLLEAPWRPRGATRGLQDAS